MDKEYIERKAVLKDLKLLTKYEDAFRQSVILGVVHTIECQPTANVVEVVHGRWEWYDQTVSWWYINRGYMCSVCGFKTEDETNYCPDCGARMDGDGNG